MKNVSYITILVDPLTFWIQLKLSLSTSWNHFQFFKLFCCFCCQLSKILKQLYFSMQNDLRTVSLKRQYDYFPIFWHLDRTLKRTVVFSAQFIFKMAANINASVVHLIYSFTQSCSRIPVESYMQSRGIPISILINVLTRKKIKVESRGRWVEI